MKDASRAFFPALFFFLPGLLLAGSPVKSEGTGVSEISDRYRRALERVALREASFILGLRPRRPDSHKSKTFARDRALLLKRPSRRGMFVSVFDARSKRLVGCMGSLFPARENLYRETLHWTRIALLHDPRRATHKRRTGRLKRIALILSFIHGVQPLRGFYFDSIRHGLLGRWRGREELVLPGEARTSAYARRMVLEKMGLRRAPPGMEFFIVRALRFGGGKKLFDPRSKDFKGYGG